MTNFLRVSTFSLGCALLMSQAANAQTPPLSSEESSVSLKRLSDTLLEEISARQLRKETDIFFLGIIWNSPAEIPFQTKQKAHLLQQLEALSDNGKVEQIQALQRLVKALPITGRVVLPEQDPRWLQANPKLDPVLTPNDKIIVSDTPTTVSVLQDDGSICTLPHAHGVEAEYYVKQCLQHAGKGKTADWAWVVQANGEVRQVGIALWNRSKQDQLSPGAWIWAPTRQLNFPSEVSEELANFIATQGPSGNLATEKHFNASSASSKQLPSNADALAESRKQQGRDLQPTAGDWGTIGLLQTPTARMEEAGHLSYTYSNTYPYTRNNIFLQPLDWLEFGFRYTNISNRSYGPQSYKDKSIDAKFRILKESAYLPELALGFRDVAGTGYFSGEYIVANKRMGNFDLSLGLGWGYLGKADTIKNPLSLFSSRFNTRSNNYGQGGKLSTDSYFHGSTAFFGGIQYQTPWDSLLLKLELDGNDYQKEPSANNQKRSSPLNIGAVYRFSPNIDISLGLERGNKALLGVSLHAQMDKHFIPKVSMPKPVPVAIKPIGSSEFKDATSQVSALATTNITTAATAQPSYRNTIDDIESQTNWRIREIRHQNTTWLIIVTKDGGYYHERLDRMIGVLHRDAPTDITHFRIRYESYGVVTAEHAVDRKEWMQQQTRLMRPSEEKKAITLESEASSNSDSIAQESSTTPSSQVIASKPTKRFDGGLGISYSHTLGGPDGFLLYNIAAEATAKVNLWKGAFVSGVVDARLIDNYDKFRTTGTSNLPRVRTYLREYLTTSRYTMPRLQATQLVKLSDSQFVSAYGGYLETMFAGVGGEYLWRPNNSRLAIGIDANKVQQRAFEQNFDLRDYKTTTGHVTAYWDTGWQDILATVSAGKYLAGDKGVTVDIRKTFKNGVTMGVFATKTNASAQQFGEGSFNKGIYLTFPFDLLLTSYSDTKGTILWTPLTRDGGAKLNRSVNLYDYTRVKDPNALEFKAGNN
ncbi:MAG: YjbH domain-containing protein [Pseudomonadota bacterium]